jgi:hypothetical protein
MTELQELRNEVLSLRNMGELTKQTESILLHKLNTLEAAINYTRCCESDSEQLPKRKRECTCSGMSDKVKCDFKCYD